MKSLPLDNILKGGGYHITPRAGKIIANSINKDPKEKTNMERQPEEKPKRTETPKQDIRPTTSTQTVTKSVTTIPTEAVRYLVGKQGKTVKKNLENEHDIEIRISQRIENDPNHTATITGPKKGVKRATEETQDIIITFQSEQETYKKRKTEKAQQSCFFFRQGNCRNGNQCPYLHDPHPPPHPHPPPPPPPHPPHPHPNPQPSPSRSSHNLSALRQSTSRPYHRPDHSRSSRSPYRKH